MSKMSKRPTVRMPTAAEDKAIIAAAKSDPDARPLTPTQLKAMVPIKSTGEGWQSRMDGVLRQYVARHSRNT